MVGDLKNLLDHVLADAGANDTDWRMTVIKKWHEVVGPIARYAVIEKIDGDTLVVAVASNIWMQELYSMSPILIKRVNQLVGGQRIAKVRFKYLQKARCSARARVVAAPSESQAADRVLNASEHAALKRVSDRELSQALRAFLMRCYHVNQA